MFLIAYPNQDQDSTFEFEYWLDGFDPSLYEKLETLLKKGNNWLIALIALLLLFVICISWLYCCYCSSWSNRIQRTPTSNEPAEGDKHYATSVSNLQLNNETHMGTDASKQSEGFEDEQYNVYGGFDRKEDVFQDTIHIMDQDPSQKS